MQKVIVNLLLLDLFYVTLQVQGFQENTFVSNSSIISCAGNKTITIVDLNVEHYTTSCSEYNQCNLTEEQTSAIKRRCNNETSCTISTIIPNACLFNKYGHVSISYSCIGISSSSCTFDNDECVWLVSGFDRYKWKLQRGKTPESSTGPDRDHTTASAYGYYAYTISDSWSNVNDVTKLQTGLIVPSSKQCLTFWYQMYGRHINTLKVLQVNSTHFIELWSKSYNQGNKWHFQSLSLEDIGPYRIMFRATRGNGYKSEIALDDIFITNTLCQKASAINCNFETDNCGWETGDTTYRWEARNDKTPSRNTGPDVDHTFGTDEGHYIYLEASDIPAGQKINLTSVIVNPGVDACFNFWYHMYGDGMGTLNVYFESDEVSRIAWSKSGNRKDRWWLAAIDISRDTPYRIIFEGILGSTTKSDIALDDIALFSGSCKEAYSLDCNFETETCIWNVEQKTGYTWRVISKSTPSANTGPKVDHTYGFHNGHYIYLEATDMQKGQTSNLTSETVYPDGDACFTFWFHMYGEGMGTLNLYLVSEEMTQKLWSRSGNKPDIWQLAFVDISILQPYQITLEGVRGSSFESDMAIDDISLLPGSCNKRAFFLDCNFEAERCYWLTDSQTPYIWTVSTGLSSTDDTSPDYDHSIKTGMRDDGHYIYLNGSSLDIREGLTSKLTSSIINPGGDICFTFWYHMYGESIGRLSVYTESGNTRQKHWSQSGNKENSWKFANFTIFKSEPYKIVFEGERGDGYASDIALDDISLLERSCSGLIRTSQSCHNIDETISLHECSKYYLELNETSLVFDPEFDNCSVVYQDVQTSIRTLCNAMDNSDICTFDFLKLIKEDKRCFQSNELLVRYTCEAEESSTFPSVMTSREGLRKGLVVGMVIGGLLLACAVILSVVLIRRHTFKSKPGEKIKINLGGNDYIGSQDIALPHTANHSSHIPYFDKQTSIDDEYAMVNPTAETSFNERTDDGIGTSDSYMVSDPNDTDYNRTTFSNTPTGFEFAKPVMDTGNKIVNDDQYDLSNEGAYDHSGDNRHKELQDNIYNHAVDTVYDSGSHIRNNEWREDTYDHFIGQKN